MRTDSEQLLVELKHRITDVQFLSPQLHVALLDMVDTFEDVIERETCSCGDSPCQRK